MSPSAGSTASRAPGWHVLDRETFLSPATWDDRDDCDDREDREDCEDCEDSDGSGLIDPTRGRGGLAVRLDEQHRDGIEADGTGMRMASRVGPARAVRATQPVPGDPDLRGVRKAEPPLPCDASTARRPLPVSLGVELLDGTRTSPVTLDGRCLPPEAAGDVVGRVIGSSAVWSARMPPGCQRLRPVR